MQIEGADIHPMRNFMRSWPAFRHTTKLMLAYVWQKLRHGRGTRLANGNALTGRLLKSALDAGVVLSNSTQAVELEIEAGRVSGVIAQRSGKCVSVTARKGVVLATGGFAADAQMLSRHVPLSAHHLSLHPESNEGDGIRLGTDAGGHMAQGNDGHCIWTPMSATHRADGSVLAYPHIFIDRSMPGSIVVDATGKRFINEADSYQVFVKTMHARGIGRAWLVAGHRFLRRYGMGLVRPAPFRIGRYIDNGYLIQGDTLAQLASRIGVPAQTFETTVREFNAGASQGEDPMFLRGADGHSRFRGDASHKPNPSLAPVEGAPYYAVALHPGDLSTVTGLETNGNAQVLDAQQQPIPGLYAAGLDMNSIMRGRYPGAGASIGPAMTFGYVAARHLHGSLNAQASG
jgi:succinate dehydrogenase/fumarate reductase flavoprotein subunit